MWDLELEIWYQFLSCKVASPYQVCGPSHSSVGTVWSCGLLTLPYWHGFNPGVHVDLPLKLVSLFVYGSLRRQRVDTGCGWTLKLRRRPSVSFPQMIIHYTRRPGVRGHSLIRWFIQVTFITHAHLLPRPLRGIRQGLGRRKWLYEDCLKCRRVPRWWCAWGAGDTLE